MREPPPIEETATSRFVTICFPTVPAPFNVFVATFQTSAASVPNDESVRVLLAQTAVGMVAARDELAVRTVELVFELIVETADETCEFVLALMTAANDVEAVRTVEFVLLLTAVVPAPIAEPSDELAVVIVPAVDAVPADIADASEDDAFVTSVFVPVMREPIDVEAVPIVDAVEAVPAVIAEAREVEAVRTVELVFELTAVVPAVIAEPRDEVAVVRFTSVASDPVSRFASERRRVANVQTSFAVRLVLVRVRVPLSQISATRVPNVVKERVGDAQTAVGIVEARDVEAVRISDWVAKEPDVRVAAVKVREAFDQISDTRVPTDVRVLVALVHTEDASVVVETRVAPTTKVLSILTRSPFGTLPQVI